MKKKGRVIIAIVLLFISVALFCISSMNKNDKAINNDMYDMNAINGIEYTSEKHDFGGCSAYIRAFLKEASDGKKESEFVISVCRTSKTQKDLFYVCEYDTILDEIVVNPDFNHIDTFPIRKLYDGDKYYGSVYAGIAPKNCKTILINGISSELVPMKFDYNGTTVEFNLYYCFINETSFSEPQITAVLNDDSKIQIQ